MIIVTDSQKYQYELANVARLFFPSEEMHWVETMPEIVPDEAMMTAVEQAAGDTRTLAIHLLLPDGRRLQRTKSFPKEQGTNCAMELGKLLYQLLCEFTGRTIDWGVLTGIRPVKLARKLRLQGHTSDEIEAAFVENYLTTPQKAALCRMTDQVQRTIVESALPKGYSLYISVPFCPSRCSYCSFVSHSTEKSLKMIPEYVDKLCMEIAQTGKIAAEAGLVLQSVYMGGGTPTILTAPQMRQVLESVREHFDLSQCTEFTVEAGRPDTITPEKLEVMRGLGVDRISVNCQTLNDHVLAAVGRRHTAQDFFEAFYLVKQYNFTAINVDLIAGLPGDTLESFRNSLTQVMALSPENITAHALTVKRAARLIFAKESILEAGEVALSQVAQMVSLSQQLLAAEDYQPYYLYRQKGTVDCLENVGFSRPGYACRYNIFIMDETHTILSVGGGGVTKLVLPGDGRRGGEDDVRIERIFNFKYPYEYLQRFDIMAEKKLRIVELLK